MPAPNLNRSNHVLIVEGYSDLLFYAEALEHLRNPNDVFIQPLGGKSNTRPRGRARQSALEAFLNPSLLTQKRAIGVIVDADRDAVATAHSIEPVLSKITGQHVREGTWTAGPPRIGLYVVPGGGRAGEIETLVWNAWADDPRNAGPRESVDAFLVCMGGQGLAPHSPDKGRIGALLAIRSDEDPRLGPGTRDRVFDLGSPALRGLLDFLEPLVRD